MNHLERATEMFRYPEETKGKLIEDHDEIIALKENGNTLKIYDSILSDKILEKILSDDDYFEYTLDVIKKMREWQLCSLYDGFELDKDSRDYHIILKGLEMIANRPDKSLTSVQKERYNEIRKVLTTYNQIKESCEGNYIVSADGIQYSIPYSDLFKVIEMPEEEINRICHDKSLKNLYGIPKEHFIYAIYSLLREKVFASRTPISTEVRDLYEKFASFQLLDVEAIGRYTETEETLHEKIEISQELRDAIFDGMDRNLSDIEKAIYIYIKMCKILTYDDEFFVLNQTGKVTKKHLNLNHISEITPKNNKVVCYEFNIIYARLLHELGINFEYVYETNEVRDSYVNEHVSLKFRCGKFLIGADSVTKIDKSDMTNAKLNKSLNGLNCNNKNEKTREEFYNILKRIYKMIENQEREKNATHSTDELLSEYAKLTSNLKETDFDERIATLMTIINDAKLNGLDGFFNILHLMNHLFTPSQRFNHASLIIVRDRNTGNENIDAIATGIITCSEAGFNSDPKNFTYYLFNPGTPPQRISLSELQKGFNTHRFEYFRSGLNVPGINDLQIEKAGRRQQQ